MFEAQGRIKGSCKAAVSNIGLDKLSPRELKILIMLARDDSNKEISRTLELAESTVKIHVQGILRKLNLAGRVQAAVYASEHGLITDKYRLPSWVISFPTHW